MSITPQKPKHPKAGLYLQRQLFDGITLFADLEQRIADLLTPQERGDAFEVFVEAYLSTQPLHQSKTVWPFAVLPLAIKSRFALGQSDVGVDGVFETQLGEFHAYQAKFRTDRPSLTWDELSTFMGLTDQISERVVITNCNELSSVVSDRRGFYAIRGTDLDRLRAEDFEAVRTWLAGAIVEHERKTPLPRQQEALDAVLGTFKEHDRTTILMPCGTGKTLVALWAAEQLGGQNILVLVPSLALVSQTLHEWVKETRWLNPSFLCVCSDPTVTSRAQDTLVLHQADVDFPVTTEREAVRSFLERTTEGVKIVFSTYQSAHVVAEGMIENMRFDLGIFDEAHKTAGREGKRFSFALQDVNLPISKRLCMTATPRHYDVQKRDKEGDAKLVYSMDVPEVYGPVAYRLSFAQAVQDKLICGYKVLISVVTSGMVNHEVLRRGEVLVEHDVIKARQVANQLAIKDALERYHITKAITFHKSVDAAASFTAHGPEGIEAHVSALQSFHVNGTMASGTRDPIMRAFAEGERTLISNARCLTEGVDVPAVDMVAFLTPKRSLVDIVQATGRAMRRNPATQKTTGYVLVPVFLEQVEGETIEEAVARAEFDEVWAVLQALQEHDEVLAEIVRHMREERGWTKGFNGQEIRERVEVLGPSVSIDTLRQSITTTIIDRLGSPWDERFGELRAFRDRFGHCTVPIQYSPSPSLPGWVGGVRTRYRAHTLRPEQIQQLETIGFVWDPLDAAWLEMYKQLKAFYESHGYTWITPANCENQSLVSWVKHQREARRKGVLSPDRVAQLNLLDFQWDPLADVWDGMYNRLLAFHQKHRHCNVPLRYAPDRQLGTWVRSLRDSYKGQRLTPERISRLDAMGFIWDALESRWQEMYESLKGFRKKYGHCNVSASNPDLGSWMNIQRKAYRNGKLSPDRISQLEALGFEWNRSDAVWAESWSQMYEAAKQFHAKHGHLKVPSNSVENKQLFDWLVRQRSHLRQERKLNKDQIAKLRLLGLTWDPYQETWEKQYAALLEYCKRHGDCAVPVHCDGFPHLNQWIGHQRRAFRSGRLSKARFEKLESIGFCWEHFADQWEEMYKALVAFRNANGHCNVPNRFSVDRSLGKWVATQRRNYNSGNLSVDRIHKLNALDFDWSRIDTEFDKRFDELRKFREHNGHCRVPARYSPNLKLGRWVAHLRGRRNRGRLTEEQLARLNALGFDWSPGGGGAPVRRS